VTALDSLLTHLGDRLLGWLLWLPRDVTLLLLAVLLMALLLGLRLLLADCEALRLLVADERRVKMLRGEARAAGDRSALARHRGVRRMLATRRARLELLSALAGLLPAMLVLHWGARRLEFLPLQADAEFALEARLPASSIGQHVHLVPQSGVSAEPAWIRFVVAATADEPLGAANWRLRATEPGDFTLMLRHREGSIAIPLEVGTRCYAPPVISHGGDITTEVRLTAYRPLGIVPPVEWLGLPAWIVGLLLVCVPGYFAARRLLRMP
jgi:hypothetical protein